MPNSLKRTNIAERSQAWVVDYSAARLRAIQRLGDRYLLARPINARSSISRRPDPMELPTAAVETQAT